MPDNSLPEHTETTIHEPWQTARGDNGTPLLELCNAMVRLYKEAFGRGPTKARAQFAGPDTLVVLLEHTMTVAERNLLAMGQHDRLRELRLVTHYALEDELRSIVEHTLGRRTIAFMSGIDIRHDVSVELLTLEPRPNAAAGDGQPEGLPHLVRRRDQAGS
jgi:uncharacterized protein YbcI